MRKKWFTITIIIITVVNLSALGMFMYNRWCPKDGAECENREVEQGDFMKHHLGLTDEQITKIKTCRKKCIPNIEALSSKMRERREELVKELMAEVPDSLRIDQILQQVDSIQVAVQREVVKHLLLEKEIYTPDQRKKFFSIISEHFSGGMK